MSRDRLIDLDSEFEVAHRKLGDFEHRIRPRVSQPIWEAPKPILGVLRVEYDGRDSWQPFAHSHHVSGGELAAVIAVRAEDGEDYDINHPVPRWCALQGPVLIDLVAFSLAVPHRWARRTGLARTLGRVPYMEPRSSVRVYGSPTAWLRGDGSGIALLERESGGIASILHACTGGIVGDDPEHARELHAIASRPIPVPRIRAAAPAAMREAAE
jgi:hypothetical protein